MTDVVTKEQVQQLTDAIQARGVKNVADVPELALDIINGFAAQFGAEAAATVVLAKEAFRHAEANYTNLVSFRAVLNATNPKDELIAATETYLGALAAAWPDSLPAELPALEVKQ